MNISCDITMDDSIIIVSGLPRSGTSMMMQMLEAGGLSIVTDRVRKADEDNPKGYYEFERVKRIKEDSSWLNGCYGKAVKMISALLPFLPIDRKYKVIFMKRDLGEVLASQKRMLARLGKSGANLSDEEMIQKFQIHLEQIQKWLEKQPNLDVLYVNFRDVINNTYLNAMRISNFLNMEMDVSKMVQTVEKKLYRQRYDKD